MKKILSNTLIILILSLLLNYSIVQAECRKDTILIFQFESEVQFKKNYQRIILSI